MPVGSFGTGTSGVAISYTYNPISIKIPALSGGSVPAKFSFDFERILSSFGIVVTDNLGNKRFYFPKTITSDGSTQSIELPVIDYSVDNFALYNPVFYTYSIPPLPTYQELSNIPTDVNIDIPSPPSTPSLDYPYVAPVNLPVNLYFPYFNVSLLSDSEVLPPFGDIPFPILNIELLPEFFMNFDSIKDNKFKVTVKGSYFDRVRRDISSINSYFKKEREYLYNKYLELLSLIDNLKDPSLAKARIESLLEKEFSAFNRYLTDKELTLLKFQLDTKIRSEQLKLMVASMRNFLSVNRSIVKTVSEINNSLYESWRLGVNSALEVERANLEVHRFNKSKIPSKLLDILSVYNSVLNEYMQGVNYVARAAAADIDIQTHTQRINLYRQLLAMARDRYSNLHPLLDMLNREKDIIATKHAAINQEMQMVLNKKGYLYRLAASLSNVLSAISVANASEIQNTSTSGSVRLLEETASTLSYFISLLSTLYGKSADIVRSISLADGRVAGLGELNTYYTKYGTEVNSLINALRSHIERVASVYDSLQTDITNLFNSIKTAEIVTEIKDIITG